MVILAASYPFRVQLVMLYKRQTIKHEATYDKIIEFERHLRFH